MFCSSQAIRQEEAVKREASEAKCLGELQAWFGILVGRDKLIVRLPHCISVLAGHEAAASKLYGGHLAKVLMYLGVWNHFKTIIITAIQKRNWFWHGDIEVDRSFYCISVTCHHLRSKVPSWRTGEAFSTVPPLPAPAEDNDVAEAVQPFRTHGPSVVMNGWLPKSSVDTSWQCHRFISVEGSTDVAKSDAV